MRGRACVLQPCCMKEKAVVYLGGVRLVICCLLHHCTASTSREPGMCQHAVTGCSSGHAKGCAPVAQMPEVTIRRMGLLVCTAHAAQSSVHCCTSAALFRLRQTPAHAPSSACAPRAWCAGWCALCCCWRLAVVEAGTLCTWGGGCFLLRPRLH
jgi:hypothetical protein